MSGQQLDVVCFSCFYLLILSKGVGEGGMELGFVFRGFGGGGGGHLNQKKKSREAVNHYGVLVLFLPYPTSLISFKINTIFFYSCGLSWPRLLLKRCQRSINR